MLKLIEKLLQSKNPTLVGLWIVSIERLVYTGKSDVAVAWVLEEDERETECLLSISHFTAREGAETGAVWLHRGLTVLAADRLHMYAAAETTVSSVGLLRSALEDLRRFRVLAICGRGNLFQSGIALPTGDEDDGQGGPVSEMETAAISAVLTGYGW